MHLVIVRLMIGLVVALTACGAGTPRPPFDAAAAASQTLNTAPSAAPNDREWQILWDAVEAKIAAAETEGKSTTDAERMLKLVAQKKAPQLGPGISQRWYDQIRYLCSECLVPAYQAVSLELDADPENKTIRERYDSIRLVHNKWVAVYNESAYQKEEFLERQGLPITLHPIPDP